MVYYKLQISEVYCLRINNVKFICSKKLKKVHFYLLFSNIPINPRLKINFKNIFEIRTNNNTIL